MRELIALVAFMLVIAFLWNISAVTPLTEEADAFKFAIRDPEVLIFVLTHDTHNLFTIDEENSTFNLYLRQSASSMEEALSQDLMHIRLDRDTGSIIEVDTRKPKLGSPVQFKTEGNSSEIIDLQKDPTA